MFKTRLISGIVLVLILIGTVGYGGNVLFALLAIVSLIGMSELYKVVHVEKTLMGCVGYLACIGYYITLLLGKPDYTLFVAIVFLVLLMAVYVFSYPTYRSEQVMCTYFGLFYVGVMLSFVYKTRMLQGGAIIVWLIFLSSWGCDTCAYCAGVLLGKHKMAPKLSPKKSVEGAVGGVIGAALLGVIFAVASNYFMGGDNSPLFFAIICAVGGLISMVGDLAASAIKRNHDIKDYGTLIPGHGGILDRFDSVIFTAPIIYYLATFMMI